MTTAINNHIAQKLTEFESTHKVTIIFAIESGSRAWGFPSVDSDYDVRFLYVRPYDDYFSIIQQRDVLETDILHDPQLGVPLDLNGWDIRKALYLALKSNSILIEWLQSPIVYKTEKTIVDELWQYVQKTADLEHIKTHYYKLFQAIWKQIECDEQSVKVKLYCYAIRPAFAFKWIEVHGTLPPMDMKSLRTGLAPYIDFDQDIGKLIALKSTAQESDIIPRNEKIDTFIESVLAYKISSFSKEILDSDRVVGDQLFRKIIFSAQNPSTRSSLRQGYAWQAGRTARGD